MTELSKDCEKLQEFLKCKRVSDVFLLRPGTCTQQIGYILISCLLKVLIMRLLNPRVIGNMYL